MEREPEACTLIVAAVGMALHASLPTRDQNTFTDGHFTAATSSQLTTAGLLPLHHAIGGHP